MTQAEIKLAAAALANARGMRHGAATIKNILDMLPDKLVGEVTEDAKAVLDALENAARIRMATMNGASLIASERQRQIDQEGYSTEHDDKHDHGELAEAALVYAESAMIQARGATGEEIRQAFADGGPYAQCDWPWFDEETGEYQGLKIEDSAIGNLIKAGALIAAEIDRLRRDAGLAS